MRDTAAFIFGCLLIASTVKSQVEVMHLDLNDNGQGQTEDRWSWGYVDVPVLDRNNPIREDPVIEKRTKEVSCTPRNRPTQDYSAPGRRISEEKCFEYMADLQYRHDEGIRAKKCQEESGIIPARPVIGGRDAKPNEFPHMGALGWQAAVGDWIFKCGSTLISHNFVLTAAHCSQASNGDTTIVDTVPKIVRMGNGNTLGSYIHFDVDIIKIINHPQYVAPKQYYDIALMQLGFSVPFDKDIQPACLWSKFDTSSLGKEATVTGWGVIETHGQASHPQLQAAAVDMIDSDICDVLLSPSCNRNWCGIKEHQMCAGKLEGGVDACQGDSGGPLQVKIPLTVDDQGTMHYIIGVTSFGIKCALQNKPGVYTRVSSFLDWIEPIVWNGNETVNQNNFSGSK